MLFHSSVCLFAFLPCALTLYFLAGARNGKAAIGLMVLASFVFYGYWNPTLLPLLALSVLVNYGLGKAILGDLGQGPARHGRLILAAGVVFNLGLIGYFKYWGFLVDTASAAGLGPFEPPDILLPLAISFFTFQQIAYLVDCREGSVKDTGFLRYALFVSFFPQLIAGPIVHHGEVLPQFGRRETFRFRTHNFHAGLVIFLLGLAKKVVLADPLGAVADTGFAAAQAGERLGFFEAWIAALAYTLQLYFDFSGYSDMAIGLARMVNIGLPLNFDSPYRATSIIDFWRRWHMTLSRFLRDYLYVRLGGNRLGRGRQMGNLMATMLLGGLWHGAGWTFVLWGGLHGLYLIANHAWLATRAGARVAATVPGQLIGWAVTLLTVILAWVLFRAEDIAPAGRIYAGMLGMNGAQLPDQMLAFLPWLAGLVEGTGRVPFLADGSLMGAVEAFALVALGLAIAVGLPNLYAVSERTRVWLLVPSFAFALQRVLFATDDPPFLYFQF